MRIRITTTDFFYKKDDLYYIRVQDSKKPGPLISWRCYVLLNDPLALVDIRHAELVTNE